MPRDYLDAFEKIADNIDKTRKTIDEAESPEIVSHDNIIHESNSGEKISHVISSPKDSSPKEPLANYDLPKQTLHVINSPENNSYELNTPVIFSHVNIASKYFKTLNAIDDVLIPTLTPTQQSIYRYMYRQSYGWQRRWCKCGVEEISKACNITQRTVINNIKSLIDIKYIEVLYGHDRNNARTFIVKLPHEIESLCVNISPEVFSYELLDETDSPEIISREINTPLHMKNLHMNEENISHENISHEQIMQEFCSTDLVPKDNIKDNIKNNNNSDDVVSLLLLYFDNATTDVLMQFDIKHEWICKWHEYIQDNKSTIKNPPGFLRTLIERGADLPLQKKMDSAKETEEYLRSLQNTKRVDEHTFKRKLSDMKSIITTSV